MARSDQRPEVLAPVGSPEALTAALRCGADAVYLGGSRFNARENASHFSGDALGEAAEACHVRGARLYLTLNTLLRQEELTPALELAEQACAQGVDALIVQDLGLARRLRAVVPGCLCMPPPSCPATRPPVCGNCVIWALPGWCWPGK